MSAQRMWQSLGMLRRGAVAGILGLAGASVAADNPDWVGYGIAGVTTLVVVGKIAGAGQRARALELEGRTGTSDVRPGRLTTLENAAARPVSIETTRNITAAGPEPTRDARLGVLIAEDRRRPQNAYLTAGVRTVAADELPGLERDHLSISVDPQAAGTVEIGEPSRRAPIDGFESPDDLPADLRLTAPRRIRGRGRAAIVAFCAAFVVAGTATGALLPNTSEIGSAVADLFVGGSGDDRAIGDPDAQLRELLARAEAAVPGSSATVRTVEIGEYSARLTAHDRQRGQDFTVGTSDAEADYNATPTTSRQTTDLSGDQLPQLQQMGEAGRAGLAESGAAGIELDQAMITAPDSDTGESLVELRYHTESGSRTVEGHLDGSLAPLFGPHDMAQSYAQAADLLRQFQLDPKTEVLTGVTIQSALADAPAIESSGLSSGGGVELQVIDAKRGAGTLTVVPGAFPTEKWSKDTSTDEEEPLHPFALTGFTAQRLADLITADAQQSGAERADIQAVAISIDPAPDGSVQATIQLGDLPTSLQTYVLVARR